MVAVAGTNGKGTVSAALSAIGIAHGRKVGFFSSPHLIDLRERFRIQGELANQDQLLSILARLNDRYGASPTRPEGMTFFELTTLAAGVLFAEEQVDLAILEVGLGGRLDAVNAYEIDLAVLTTLGLDHQEYLGNSLESIAYEKAGIMRENRPAVMGPQEKDCAVEFLRVQARKRGVSTFVEVPALESEQVRDKHFRTAREAARLLFREDFREELFHQAKERMFWPGRLDWRSPPQWPGKILFDGAHNPDGVQHLRLYLQATKEAIGWVIWGAMADKSQKGTREFLRDLGVPVYGALIDNPRSCTREDLQEVIPENNCAVIGTVPEVLREAQIKGQGAGLVFGSLFLIGAVMDHLGIVPEELRTYRTPEL